MHEKYYEVDRADVLIGNSFGTSIGHESVNRHLAEHMLTVAEGRPMVADRTLVNATPGGDAAYAHIVEGAVTNLKVRGVGTWGTLVAAKEYMDANGLETALMFAQQRHAQRVMRQAGKLGIVSILADNLTAEYDRDSDQIWTRSAALWIPFNAFGSILLKKRGQL